MSTYSPHPAQADIQHTRPGPDPIAIFVYGTLRQGEINDLVRTAARAGLPAPRYLGRAQVRGTLYDFGDWPGLLAQQDGHAQDDDPMQDDCLVQGEVYLVTDALLALIDQIEEYEPAGGSCFVRRSVRLQLDGRELDCQYYPVDPAQLGDAMRTHATDWIEYRTARERRK